MKKYYWDFFGPQAQGTAQHFRIHLDGFLDKRGLRGCETGVETSAPLHHAAWCKAPDEAQSMVESALRPKRVLAD